jgi:hypothetical protein
MLLAFSFYCVTLWRLRQRGWRSGLAVLCLLAVAVWGIKVCIDAYGIAQIYQAYSSSSSFVSFASITVTGSATDPVDLSGLTHYFDTVARTTYGSPYVYQLYILLFLALAVCVLLLRHTLKLKLALAGLPQTREQIAAQQDEEDSEDELTEDTEIPEDYIVEVVAFDKARRLSTERE